MLKSWYTCIPDNSDKCELCRIQKVLPSPAGRHGRQDSGSNQVYWCVITYYEGKELYSGTLAQCKKWIESHWIEKRYLDEWQK